MTFTQLVELHTKQAANLAQYMQNRTGLAALASVPRDRIRITLEADTPEGEPVVRPVQTTLGTLTDESFELLLATLIRDQQKHVIDMWRILHDTVQKAFEVIAAMEQQANQAGIRLSAPPIDDEEELAGFGDASRK